MIKNSYQKWQGGSEGEMSMERQFKGARKMGVLDAGIVERHKGGPISKTGTYKLKKGEHVLTEKQANEYRSGASTEREENRHGRVQPDRVRPVKQTMPVQAQQAQEGEYPWEVEGHSHNEVHDRQPHDGVNRQILCGQNFDEKELEGDKDLAFSERHLMASKRGALPKGQK